MPFITEILPEWPDHRSDRARVNPIDNMLVTTEVADDLRDGRLDHDRARKMLRWIVGQLHGMQIDDLAGSVVDGPVEGYVTDLAGDQ
ncbi:hypothetical protein [Fodinicola feengrottensis]|uniref:hypothetical protein n=1 Tax=Fodinicola feengrottensis TaxID=435914 RepID=UPI00244148D7|nr:hypothetical protein [Fodinicola feengrottensis]